MTSQFWLSKSFALLAANCLCIACLMVKKHLKAVLEISKFELTKQINAFWETSWY